MCVVVPGIFQASLLFVSKAMAYLEALHSASFFGCDPSYASSDIYTLFLLLDLPIGPISCSICYWQAFPALYNVFGQALKPSLERSI